MAANFLPLTVTPAVLAAQERTYGKARAVTTSSALDPLGEDEAQFIAQRDSFYLSTINEKGWPYIQHRGGPRGFLKILDAHTLGFADLRGNRQLLTTGNLAANKRVALFIMDYPRRERLKILGHARTFLAADEPALAALINPPSSPSSAAVIERFFVIDVVAFDWNCPQHITPRYTAEEVTEATQPLRDRIAELEAALAKHVR
jgi:predicted pyridoxine 5'-phosphate oxidase superfamily flavin-nucleotide-binding protein